MRKFKMSHGSIVIFAFTMIAFVTASFCAVVEKDILSEIYFLAAGICGFNALIWAIESDTK